MIDVPFWMFILPGITALTLVGVLHFLITSGRIKIKKSKR